MEGWSKICGNVRKKQAEIRGSGVISAVKGFDNDGVHSMSNFVGAEPTTKVQRYDRKTIRYWR